MPKPAKPPVLDQQGRTELTCYKAGASKPDAGVQLHVPLAVTRSRMALLESDEYAPKSTGRRSKP
jgi:hypothetical protein